MPLPSHETGFDYVHSGVWHPVRHEGAQWQAAEEGVMIGQPGTCGVALVWRQQGWQSSQCLNLFIQACAHISSLCEAKANDARSGGDACAGACRCYFDRFLVTIETCPPNKSLSMLRLYACAGRQIDCWHCQSNTCLGSGIQLLFCQVCNEA